VRRRSARVSPECSAQPDRLAVAIRKPRRRRQRIECDFRFPHFHTGLAQHHVADPELRVDGYGAARTLSSPLVVACLKPHLRCHRVVQRAHRLHRTSLFHVGTPLIVASHLGEHVPQHAVRPGVARVQPDGPPVALNPARPIPFETPIDLPTHRVRFGQIRVCVDGAL